MRKIFLICPLRCVIEIQDMWEKNLNIKKVRVSSQGLSFIVQYSKCHQQSRLGKNIYKKYIIKNDGTLYRYVKINFANI